MPPTVGPLPAGSRCTSRSRLPAQSAAPAREAEKKEEFAGSGKAAPRGGARLELTKTLGESYDDRKASKSGGVAAAPADAGAVAEPLYRKGSVRASGRPVDRQIDKLKEGRTVAVANIRMANALHREGYHELASVLVPIAADDKNAKTVVMTDKRDSETLVGGVHEDSAHYQRKRAPSAPDASAFCNVFFVETSVADGKQASRVTFRSNSDDVASNRKRLSAQGDVYVYYRTPEGKFALLAEPETADKDDRSDADEDRVKLPASKPAAERSEVGGAAPSASPVSNLVVIVPRAAKE